MTNNEFIESIRLEGEEWKDVVGYEGIYMISNYARILSLITEIQDIKRNRKRDRKLLNPGVINRRGKLYRAVRLYKDKKQALKYIHRLVAEAFIPNPNNLSEVDHIDRDGLNNSLSNLRWCTHKENQNNENTKRAMSNSQTGLPRISLYVPVVKLKDGKLIKAYKSISSVKEDGYLPSGVQQNLRGRSHCHYGFQWMYLSDYESLINKSKNSLPAPNTADYPQ